jgi:hypothetical protein
LDIRQNPVSAEMLAAFRTKFPKAKLIF